MIIMLLVSVFLFSPKAYSGYPVIDGANLFQNITEYILFIAQQKARIEIERAVMQNLGYIQKETSKISEDNTASTIMALTETSIQSANTKLAVGFHSHKRACNINDKSHAVRAITIPISSPLITHSAKSKREIYEGFNDSGMTDDERIDYYRAYRNVSGTIKNETFNKLNKTRYLSQTTNALKHELISSITHANESFLEKAEAATKWELDELEYTTTDSSETQVLQQQAINKMKEIYSKHYYLKIKKNKTIMLALNTLNIIEG